MITTTLARLESLQGQPLAAIEVDVFSLGGVVDFNSALPKLFFATGDIVKFGLSHGDDSIIIVEGDASYLGETLPVWEWLKLETEVGAWISLRAVRHPIINALVGSKLISAVFENNDETAVTFLRLLFERAEIRMHIGPEGIQTRFEPLEGAAS